ncbi:MAG: hypothetical protein J0L86_16840 [Flavobacteriales bacterium]|nr:hypothetical protein [Flavobacteriales bacterium]
MRNDCKICKVFGIVVIFFGFFYLLTIDYKKGFDLVLKTIKLDSYEGIVIDKYYDKKNHNNPTLILSTNRSITLYGEQYSQINLNDSLSKKKNSTKLYVFKKDRIIVIDLKEYIETLKMKR